MVVRQLLDGKGRDFWSVGPEESVFDALRLMADKNIGAVLVMEDDRLIGILSERDYARKVILQGKSSRKTPVQEIMSRRVTCIEADKTIEGCMALMTDKRIRHLPVLNEGRLDGVISIGDVVKAIIAEKQFVIEQLESYIAGHV